MSTTYSEMPTVINLSGIECWMLNLLPFDAEHRWDSNVLPFQLSCVDQNIFGIGWYSNVRDYGAMTSSSIDEYLSDYESRYGVDSSQKNAVARMSEISVGHYVIMRLRNSHYYIGRVDQAPRYNSGIEKDHLLSWYCHVDKWAEFENEEQLPSEIIGRFSQQLQPTIVRIGSVRQKLLIMQAYEKLLSSPNSECPPTSIPSITLNVSNFSRSLNYRELEDLVCAHIFQRHPGYMLLPSSCKTNHFKYEFTFVKHGSKPITCQVKNQTDLPDISNYLPDTSYEKIYLYSGVLTDEDVSAFRGKYQDYTHIAFISPCELFDTLCSFDYFLSKMGDYYTIGRDTIPVVDILQQHGWREVRAFRGASGHRYKKYDDSIYLDSDSLFFYNDMNAIIYIGSDYAQAQPLISEVLGLIQSPNIQTV